MEFNWKMFRWALIFGAGIGILQIINVLTAYQTPPDWWTVVRFAVLPAIATFIATVLQSVPKPDFKKVGQICLVLAISAYLIGCGAASKDLIKFNAENVQAMKAVGQQELENWSFSSGFIMGLGVTDKLKFPITTASELRPLIGSSYVALAITEMDELAHKTLNPDGKTYWNDQDYAFGYALGCGVRLRSQAAIDFMKLIAPDLLAKYAPMLIGL